MKNRHAALLLVTLASACGGQALDLGSQGGGGESGGREDAGGKANVGSPVPTYGGAVATAPKGGTTSYGAGGQFSGSATTGFGGAAAAYAGSVADAGATVGGSASGPLNPNRCPMRNPIGQVTYESWQGYTEDFFFKQLQKWQLDVGIDSIGQMCGTATYVGQGQAPPGVPADLNAEYPPGAQVAVRDAWPGVGYSVVEGATRNSAMHFRVAATELYADWCLMQKPYPVAGMYTCVPEDAKYTANECSYVDQLTLIERQLPPMKCDACVSFNVCYCDWVGCFAADAWPIVFDLNRNDESTMTGTVTDENGSVTITLARIAR